MDFALPEHLPGLLAEMDAFIEAEIKPLEREHMQYFDRRREFARTDIENGGIPRREWEDLLDEMRRRADASLGLLRALPDAVSSSGGAAASLAERMGLTVSGQAMPMAGSFHAMAPSAARS